MQTLVRTSAAGPATLAEDRKAGEGNHRTSGRLGPGLLEVFGQRITPRRILVIEDKPDIADTMKTALTLSGHVVDVALDGEEGIRKALETHPEVILSDIGLPGAADGFQVARTLRSSGLSERTYMVAVTGSSDTEDVMRALAAGFDLHMAKPVDMRALLRLIAEWFDESDV
jgi:DNA-binding response OmpR family regulator